MLPSGANDLVSAPAVTLTVGSPNRVASAGARKSGVRPPVKTMAEPSEFRVSFVGPVTFSLMVFPVLRFVYEIFKEPVSRKIMDPSEALRILTKSLSTTGVTCTTNPQNSAGSVKGAAGTTCHWGPRARAGEAVTTPPDMP